MKEMRAALSCIKKNDDTFFLIPKGEKVLLPISKSDHSLFLYECLRRYAMYSQKDFKLVPVCFRFSSDEEVVEGFPVLEHLEVEQERLAREIASRSYESYLAKLRRLAYANEAENNGCSLIALPTTFEDFYFHYQDNLLRLGKVQTYSPYAPASEYRAFIRPLLSFSEADIKKGEEELRIKCEAPVRECPLSKKEKDSFLKATCYGETASNLPLSKKRETLELCPNLYFERDGDELLTKDIDGFMMASFTLNELDAHRVYLSDFYFHDDSYKEKILSSFFSYWRAKKKPPVEFSMDFASPFKFDKTWKLVGDAYTKKFW